MYLECRVLVSRSVLSSPEVPQHLYHTIASTVMVVLWALVCHGTTEVWQHIMYVQLYCTPT